MSDYLFFCLPILWSTGCSHCFFLFVCCPMQLGCKTSITQTVSLFGQTLSVAFESWLMCTELFDMWAHIFYSEVSCFRGLIKLIFLGRLILCSGLVWWQWLQIVFYTILSKWACICIFFFQVLFFLAWVATARIFSHLAHLLLHSCLWHICFKHICCVQHSKYSKVQIFTNILCN